MRLKKIPAFLGFVVILIIGYLCIQIIPPLFYQDNEINSNNDTNNCPEYIEEFVTKNPQAKELKVNYTAIENNEPIDLSIPNGIPLYIQWDKRWAYTHYGDEIVGTAGCGPTCLAMVSVGLTGNTAYNPRYIATYAREHDYLEGSMTRWALMSEGCEAFGIKASQVALNKSTMIDTLAKGHPIICSMRPGDFTETGHFIVIIKSENGKFIVNDPNSKENSQRQWSYDQLQWQIKAMWSYSLI